MSELGLSERGMSELRFMGLMGILGTWSKGPGLTNKSRDISFQFLI